MSELVKSNLELVHLQGQCSELEKCCQKLRIQNAMIPSV